MPEPTAVLLAHADGRLASTPFTPGSLGAKDPFDRLIVSQALEERLPVVSVDPVMPRYGVERVW